MKRFRGKIKNLIKNERGKIIKETFWSAMAKGVAFFGYMAFQYILLQFFPPDLYGEWAYLYSFITILVTVSYLGINHIAKVFVAKYKETTMLKSILNGSLFLRGIVSFLGSIFLYIVVKLFNTELLSIGVPSQMFQYIDIICIFLILSGFSEFFKSLFTGFNRQKYFFYITLVEYFFQIVLLFIFLRSSVDNGSVLISLVLSLLLGCVVGFFVYKNVFYKKSTGEIWNKKILKRLWIHSWPLFLLVLGDLFLTQGDIILGKFFLNDFDFGLYSASKNFLIKIPQISLVFAAAVMPTFADLKEENREKLNKRFRESSFFVVITVTLLILLMLLLSKLIVKHFLGIDYIDALPYFRLLLIQTWLLSIDSFIFGMMDYTGYARERMKNYIVVVVVFLILVPLITSLWGIYGLCISVSILSALRLLLNLRKVLDILNNRESDTLN